MQRRDLLKLLTSVATLSAIPLDLTMGLQQAWAQTAMSIGMRTLNPHQDSTVTTISELILPATDTPGAKGAKVNEFIDLLLTEWFDRADAERFLDGLAGVDALSRKRFSADFISCTPAQQNELMKQLDDGAMEFVRKQREQTNQVSQTSQGNAAKKSSRTKAAVPEPPNFFYTLKKLTIFGYYTSKIGFSQELGEEIIPPGHDGCAPLPERAQ
jgi:Gluconate 2-dehydrogenase subunit 3